MVFVCEDPLIPISEAGVLPVIQFSRYVIRYLLVATENGFLWRWEAQPTTGDEDEDNDDADPEANEATKKKTRK